MATAINNMAGTPVVCLLPECDRKRMATLSGDPEVNSVVTEADYDDVGRLCGMLLRSLPYGSRRSALYMASGLMDGNQIDVVPVHALFPRDITVDQLARLWNGLMTMLLSLGSSSADTSVGTVIANASAMASGAPFASDPLVGERQNEVVLAKAILEAALLGDEEAQEWFADNKLADALKAMAIAAPSGTSDASQEYAEGLSYVNRLYDCALHNEPLGGDVMAGGSLAEFFSDTVNALKEGVGNAVSSLGKAAGQAVKSLGGSHSSSQSGSSGAVAVQAAKSKAMQADKGMAATTSPAAVSTVTSSASPAVNASIAKDVADVASEKVAELGTTVNSGVQAAKDALADAKQALDAGNASIAEYKAKLRESGLQSARLQWAEAILDAPDEVATILSATTPNLADPGTFLQSMLATLPAAKETGNLGTIKALVYALRSAAAKGDGSASALYSLLSGDLTAVVDDVEHSDDANIVPAIEAQKRHLESVK